MPERGGGGTEWANLDKSKSIQFYQTNVTNVAKILLLQVFLNIRRKLFDFQTFMNQTHIINSTDIIIYFTDTYYLYYLKIACADLRSRVEDILRHFNLETKTFMAIALKNASVDMFEVDFHDIERGMLTRVGGCVYKVIKLIKYLRDTKGGTMTKLWSHLLKVRAYGKDQISNESSSDRCASSCSARKQEYLE